MSKDKYTQLSQLRGTQRTMLLLRCFTLLFLTVFATVQATVPMLIYSHKLVPKVQSYINHHNTLIFPTERVHEVSKRLIEQCTSNAYVFVNQPGLTLEDLQHLEGFLYLRTHSLKASTLGLIPRLEKPVDFNMLSDYARSKCSASLIELEGFEEVRTYIDTKKRVIRIDFPELPTGNETARVEALKKADLALRKTLRKLPSPDHSLFYTTLDKRLVNKNQERRWQHMELFPDLLKQDVTRAEEYERNNNVIPVERPFPEKRTKLIDPSKYYIPKFLDAELILENELLVLGILFVTLVMITYQLTLIGVSLTRMVHRKCKDRTRDEQEKNEKNEKETKKDK